MITDRDRVEVALTGYWNGIDWNEDNDPSWVFNERDRMFRALAAVDALAPRPLAVADAAVRRFALAILHGDEEHRAWLTDAAEAFIAGERMPEPRGGGEPAPPPVPEDVRPWRVGQHYGIHVYADDRPVATFFRADEAERAVNLHNAALATPAPPADACDLTPEEASSLVATLSRNGTRDRVEVAKSLLEMEKGLREAAEARLARAQEALEKASERLQWVSNHAPTQTASWIANRAHAYAEEARRALADSEPAGRAALAAEGE